MIRRIQEIVGVGSFENFKRGGSYQFEPMTLFFGLNTYGKSTLADIFRALNENNITILKNRKTIGKQSQSVQINFIDDSDRENSVNFKNEQWNNINGFPYQIEIFDTKFIEKNIFTGLTITRDNKERLTEFVLGEEGVTLANKIKELKRVRDELSNNQIKNLEKEILNELQPHSFDLSEFLRLDVSSCNKESLEKKIENIKNKINRINDNKKNIDSILKLKTLWPIEIKPNFFSLFQDFNNLLAKNYENLNQAILEKIYSHINSSFKKKDKLEEEWIRKGFYYVEGQISSLCPFCGQPLDKSELFTLYQKYFSEGYKKFFEQIESNLERVTNTIEEENNKFNLLDNTSINKIIDEASKYIDSEKWNNKIGNFNNLLIDLNQELKEYKNTLNNLLKDLRDKKNEKIQSPYKSIDKLNISDISELENKINKIIINLNKQITDISNLINDFKKKFENQEELKKELDRLQQSLTDYNIKLLRIKLKDKCDKLNRQKEKLNHIKSQITEKETKLKETQETFINNYFEKVNNIFESLGSRNFKIEKKIERRGYKNTISLEIKYRDKPVSYDDIEFILSDSDKRALAFSIFLAKLENMQTGQLRNTIIILDDPITSFDDNRIRVTILKIMELYSKARQIIILSHYEDFLRNLLLSMNNKYALYKIKRTANGSEFESVEKNNLLLDEHEKMFVKIKRFVDNESSDDITRDLRIFLENEIKIRFRLILYEKRYLNLRLKNLIEKLYEENLINEARKDKLHNFREQLNPDHHSYIGHSNSEDIRTFAGNLLNFIYET